VGNSCADHENVPAIGSILGHSYGQVNTHEVAFGGGQAYATGRVDARNGSPGCNDIWIPVCEGITVSAPPVEVGKDVLAAWCGRSHARVHVYRFNLRNLCAEDEAS
jgi:hypothetical protein